MKIPGINTERLSSIFSANSNLHQATQCFTIKAIRNETDTLNRVAIITGKKKISKFAVIRNRADRRIKAAVQTVYPNLRIKGYDFLLFSQPPVITTPWASLVKDVERSFKNIERKIIPSAKANNMKQTKKEHKEKSST